MAAQDSNLLIVKSSKLYPLRHGTSYTGIAMLAYFNNSICIVNWQNVIETHHASAHGESSDLIAKLLDLIILK